MPLSNYTFFFLKILPVNMDKENNFIENITYTEIHKDDSNDLNRAGYN